MVRWTIGEASIAETLERFRDRLSLLVLANTNHIENTS